MRRTIATLLLLAALALIIAGVSLPLAPQWLTLPGGLLLLVVAAFVGITQLGEGLLAWRDLLFGKKKTGGPEAAEQIASGANARNIKAGTYVENLGIEQTFPEPKSGAGGPGINIEAGKDLNLGTFVGGDQNISNTTYVYPPAPEIPPQPLLGSIPPLTAEVYIERGIEPKVFAALRGNGVAAIVGLHAPGGVGKSEMAKRALQELRGEFESVLWVDVGEKTAPLLAPEMLRACGQTPPDNYPAQVQALRAAFVAHRYLVVLDDLRADAQAQLKDFLPPAPPCAVLITSRIEQPSHLIPLKNTFELDQMTPAQARQLLAAVLGEEVVAAEEATFAAMAARCRWNALAVEIAARRIRQYQGLTAPGQIYWRKLEAHGLSEMRAEGDARWNMTAVFDASYDDLTPADQQRFRALAAFHPTGFSPEAATHLWQAEAPVADEALRRLRNLSLIKTVPGEVERYRLHDLLDEYAADKLRAASEADAAHRALAEWLITLFGEHYGDDLSNAPEVALELDNLRQAAQWMTTAKDGNQLARLATQPRNWLYNIFRINAEWEAWLTNALQFGIEERGLRANVLQAIGDVQQFRDDRDAALASYEEALRLFKQVGAKLGEANVLSAQARLALQSGDVAAAEEQLRAVITIRRAIGDLYSEGADYGNFAMALLNHGHKTEAKNYALKAKPIFERLQIDYVVEMMERVIAACDQP